MKTIPCLLIAAVIGGTSFAEEGKRELPERPIPATIMKEFDHDGDGTLSQEERSEMHRIMRERREARRQELLKRFDADGDGHLNEAERSTARETTLKEMLAKYDADGDGTLNDAERKAMFDGEGYNPMRFASRRPRAEQGQRMGMKRDRGPAGDGRSRFDRRQGKAPQE